MSALHYDYSASKARCESLGLIWFSDEYMRASDEDAYRLGMTQEQVDTAVWHALCHVKTVFTPQIYPWQQRLILAFWFLFGRWKK